LPARPRSPRDKAKVEVGVQIAERWLLARIRNETFTSLGALNARLRELPLCQRRVRQLPLDISVPKGGEWCLARAQAIPKFRT
jgi:hypothetical protein